MDIFSPLPSPMPTQARQSLSGASPAPAQCPHMGSACQYLGQYYRFIPVLSQIRRVRCDRSCDIGLEGQDRAKKSLISKQKRGRAIAPCTLSACSSILVACILTLGKRVISEWLSLYFRARGADDIHTYVESRVHSNQAARYKRSCVNCPRSGGEIGADWGTFCFYCKLAFATDVRSLLPVEGHLSSLIDVSQEARPANTTMKSDFSFVVGLSKWPVSNCLSLIALERLHTTRVGAFATIGLDWMRLGAVEGHI
eukprot:6173521-Pleurochrysis_carterae.AAC.3